MPFIALVALTIAATYWTYRDAAARDMNARGWALFMALTSGIGLPFYVLARKPPADLSG